MLEEMLSFTKWKKKYEILKEFENLNIRMNERKFRKQVEINNKLFGEGLVDYYICHSSKGYKKSFNWTEIESSIADKRKRALTMLAECSKAKKQFQRRNNVQLKI